MSKSKLFFLCLLGLKCLENGAADEEYLKEQPSFLTPCSLHEKPQNSTCFSRALESIFINWNDGIPGLSAKHSIDPFRVKRVRLSQVTDTVDIKFELRNMTAYGLSKAKAIRTAVNEQDYTIIVQLHLPFMTVLTDYQVKGNILRLNLNAQGKLTTESTALNFTYIIKSDLIQRDNVQFLNVTSFAMHVQSIGNYHVNFTNLFNGNRILEESANELFNLSWREFFNIMRPSVEQTFDRILIHRYRNLLNYLPAKYLFNDLP